MGGALAVLVFGDEKVCVGTCLDCDAFVFVGDFDLLTVSVAG